MVSRLYLRAAAVLALSCFVLLGGCKDDLGLEEVPWPCDESLPCAEGYDCLDGYCARVVEVPDVVAGDLLSEPDAVDPDCEPDCEGRECGPDPECGVSCGTCPAAAPHCVEGLCQVECEPDCAGRVCGSDGCGGECPPGCDAGYECAEESGICVDPDPCTPDCAGRECGPDGCGGSCGTCPGAQDACVDGWCVCEPDCAGRVCGPDGCGGSCGTCPGAQDTCVNGVCVCEPDCAGRVCGPDGCGGSCGTCSGDTWCTPDGDCSPRSVGYVLIPSGSFTMGSPSGEPGRFDREGPQHEVVLTRSFYLKSTQVTQGEWESLMGNNPSRFSSCGSECPVEQVSWWDSVAYCNALSRHEGLAECYTLTGCSGTPGVSGYSCGGVTFAGLGCTGYRLPTEAEWEYAYRAGTTTAFYNGPITHTGSSPVDPNLDVIGWYGGNSDTGDGRRTHPVGLKTPNAWDL